MLPNREGMSRHERRIMGRAYVSTLLQQAGVEGFQLSAEAGQDLQQLRDEIVPPHSRPDDTTRGLISSVFARYRDRLNTPIHPLSHGDLQTLGQIDALQAQYGPAPELPQA